MEIKRSDFDKVKNNPPRGYRFSSRPLTKDGKRRLHGYWLNLINYNELLEEVTTLGQRDEIDRVFLSRYESSYSICVLFLLEKKLIVSLK
jgi:hypothetical protein